VRDLAVGVLGAAGAGSSEGSSADTESADTSSDCCNDLLYTGYCANGPVCPYSHDLPAWRKRVERGPAAAAAGDGSGDDDDDGDGGGASGYESEAYHTADDPTPPLGDNAQPRKFVFHPPPRDNNSATAVAVAVVWGGGGMDDDARSTHCLGQRAWSP
jgi:hypothetical protein